MTAELKPRDLNYEIYRTNDGQYAAVRMEAPMFCFIEDTASAAIKKALGAIEFYVKWDATRRLTMADKPSEKAVEIARREAYEEYGRAKTWENGVFNCQRFSEHVLTALIRAGYDQLKEPK